MMSRGIPERWQQYSNFKGVIEECHILPCKTPLKEFIFRKGLNNNLLESEQHFTPNDLCTMAQDTLDKRVEFIIDLTNTSRYYDKGNFSGKHYKIECPGRCIPPQNVYSKFHVTMEECLQDISPQGVIAVHCTHGVNRTGFIICNYLMNKHDYSLERAIQTFNKARGHDIEREEYIAALKLNKYPEPSQEEFESFKKSEIGTDFIVTDSIPKRTSKDLSPRPNNKKYKQKHYHQFEPFEPFPPHFYPPPFPPPFNFPPPPHFDYGPPPFCYSNEGYFDPYPMREIEYSHSPSQYEFPNSGHHHKKHKKRVKSRKKSPKNTSPTDNIQSIEHFQPPSPLITETGRLSPDDTAESSQDIRPQVRSNILLYHKFHKPAAHKIDNIHPLPISPDDTTQSIPIPSQEGIQTTPIPSKEVILSISISPKEDILSIPISPKEAIQSNLISPKEDIQSIPISPQENIQSNPISPKEDILFIPIPSNENILSHPMSPKNKAQTPQNSPRGRPPVSPIKHIPSTNTSPPLDDNESNANTSPEHSKSPLLFHRDRPSHSRHQDREISAPERMDHDYSYKHEHNTHHYDYYPSEHDPYYGYPPNRSYNRYYHGHGQYKEYHHPSYGPRFRPPHPPIYQPYHPHHYSQPHNRYAHPRHSRRKHSNYSHNEY